MLIVKKFLFCFIWISCLPAYALVANIYKESRQNFDSSRPTHLLVATPGDELASLPFETALSQARYIKNIYPDDQVVVISEFDLKNQKINQFSISNLETVYYTRHADKGYQFLSTLSLINFALLFPKIKSFHIFGHSNIPYGAKMSNGFRFGWNPGEFSYIERLGPNFTPDAYAILHGCNSGWDLALRLSKIWKIPVAGSFTGTIFQKLGTDGNFYPIDKKGISFSTKATSLRQVPQNSVYHGHYGSYFSPSLNFFKFYCAAADENRCFIGMAKSMMTTVNAYAPREGKSTQENFKLMVADMLCASTEGNSRNECVKTLIHYGTNPKLTKRNYFFMNNKLGQLDVNFSGHNGSVFCNKYNSESELMCEITAPTDLNSDTLIREYEAYLKGFKLLEESQK